MVNDRISESAVLVSYNLKAGREVSTWSGWTFSVLNLDRPGHLGATVAGLIVRVVIGDRNCEIIIIDWTSECWWALLFDLVSLIAMIASRNILNTVDTCIEIVQSARTSRQVNLNLLSNLACTHSTAVHTICGHVAISIWVTPPPPSCALPNKQAHYIMLILTVPLVTG